MRIRPLVHGLNAPVLASDSVASLHVTKHVPVNGIRHWSIICRTVGHKEREAHQFEHVATLLGTIFRTGRNARYCFGNMPTLSDNIIVVREIYANL